MGEPSLEQFVAVAQGRKKVITDPEKAWQKFNLDYPRYAE
jgi:uncharacterized protein YifE (UPF0438 family)